jgi:hypothetical protein
MTVAGPAGGAAGVGVVLNVDSSVMLHANPLNTNKPSANRNIPLFRIK